MIYLDSDFLIHYLVVQNKEKHRIAKKRILKTIRDGRVFVSLLALQEISFVLYKIGYDAFEIEQKMTSLEPFCSKNYDLTEFQRAKFLASEIGFQNINDCLHTAIAESYCDEIYTFNRKDFTVLKQHTDIKISIF